MKVTFETKEPRIIFKFNVEGEDAPEAILVPIDAIKSAKTPENYGRETIVETHEGRSFTLPIRLPDFMTMTYWAREKALFNADPINYHVVDICPHGYFDHVMKQVEFDKEFVMEFMGDDTDDGIYTFFASSKESLPTIQRRFMEWIIGIDEKLFLAARNQEMH